MIAKITPQDVKTLLDSTQNFYLIDVRTQYEFCEIHIKNALNMPSCMVWSLAPELLLDKNALIVLYCATGMKSAQVGTVLQKMGYPRVYNLGSFYNWAYETQT